MKILVIVDMQNDFVTGCLGSPEAQAIVPIMEQRLLEYEGDTLVVFTKDTHYDDYMDTQEGKNLPVSHCKFMTPGWSIVKSISSIIDHGNYMKLSYSDVINGRINKTTFGSLQLAKICSEIVKSDNIVIDEIILMGVCTDICVISNAMLLKAYCPETLITVDASCCAGVTPEKHKNALEAMRSCQINVIND